MTTTRSLTLLLAVAVTALALAGCVTNSATFYEGTRVALAGEYNPTSGQPVNLSFGFKRRIAAIVPPQKAAPPATDQNPNPIATGEALSLVSLFDVGPGGPNFGDGLIIRSAFAAGMAARDLTDDPNAAQSIQSLFAKETLPLLSKNDAARKRALWDVLRKQNVTEAQSARILQIAGVNRPVPPGCPQGRTSFCTLRRALSETDELTLGRLEAAVKQVLPAPGQ